MLKKISFILLLLTIILSCSKKPKPIEYGSNICDFCKMNIVNRSYGTELVTDKGKIYKFDSSECLLHFQKENPNLKYAHTLTNTLDNPGEFTPIDSATFLICEALPSPMGANITAFSKKSNAEEIQKEKGGDLYDFNSLKQKILNK